MLQRFCELKNCVKKALIDLKSGLQWEDWEFDRLNDLVTAFEPLKLTVEALCRRDFDLLQADETLNFALTKLDLAGSAISDELSASLKIRIDERRTEFSGILQYLHRGSVINENLDEIFKTPSKPKIADTLKLLILRLNPELDSEETQDIPEVVLLDESEPMATRRKGLNPLKDELEMALDKAKEGSSTENAKIQPKTLFTTIKQEMKLFEANGTRGHHLNLCYQYLKSIVPTSFVILYLSFKTIELIFQDSQSSLFNCSFEDQFQLLKIQDE